MQALITQQSNPQVTYKQEFVIARQSGEYNLGNWREISPEARNLASLAML